LTLQLIMSNVKLYIGGKESHQDWKILDVEKRPEVDIVSNVSCLETIADESISVIYASHVVENFHYGLDNKLIKILSE
jgi:predicted SAM-dependent methyltransferase